MSPNDQGPAGGGPFVLMKPVWASPTLSSCNRLLSYRKALDLAAELWALWPPKLLSAFLLSEQIKSYEHLQR